MPNPHLNASAAPVRSSSLTVAHPTRVTSPSSRFGLIAIGLVFCFYIPLLALLRQAWHSDLYSYVLLMPFITGYLLWLKRGHLPPASVAGRKLALIPLIVGLGLL